MTSSGSVGVRALDLCHLRGGLGSEQGAARFGANRMLDCGWLVERAGFLLLSINLFLFQHAG